MPQRMTLEQLHGDKRTPFEFSDIVNGTEVRVIERRCGARFTTESINRLRIPGDVVGKEFEGHKPAQPCVLGFIDYAHTSAAKLFEDGVMGDGSTDDRGSIWHLPRSLLQPLKVGNAVHTVRMQQNKDNSSD